MCIRPETDAFLQPLADLTGELMEYENANVRDFAWVGVTAFYGLLENL